MTPAAQLNILKTFYTGVTDFAKSLFLLLFNDLKSLIDLFNDCPIDNIWTIRMHLCVSEQRIKWTELLLLALAMKRRRLGYVHSGNSRWKKILLLHGSLSQRRSKLATEMEKKREMRRWWTRPVFADHDTFGAWATVIPTLRKTDEDLYYNFLRMTPAAFDRLLREASPFMKKISWRKAISPGKRLAITLRYLATGDSQASLSFLFRVSGQAISNILLETTTVIWHVLQHVVFPKLTEDFWMKTASEFEVLWNVPHCLGAVDGKLVNIKAFPHSGSRYYSYKKRYCISFLTVADAKHRLIVVESGASGKRSDANIFYKSSFYKKLTRGTLDLPLPCPVTDDSEENMPFYFIGDNAYTKMGNFATPFKGLNLKDEEMVYNDRLSRARRIVKNAFSILTARYRILFRPIEGSPSLVKSTILACLALHNYHLQDEESVPPRRRKYRPHGYTDYIREDGKYIYGRWRNENPAQEQKLFRKLSNLTSVSKRSECTTLKGKELAEMLLSHFILKPVPWQWQRANVLF